MFKLFKNFNKKDIFLIIIIFILILLQVWLDLKMPDYMSEITTLVQTKGSKMNDILRNGLYMLLCTFGSLITSFIVGYIISFVSANFSLKTRKELFDKVESLSLAEIKNLKLVV